MEVFHTTSVSGREFDRILAVLRDEEVIGYPTDTAYGLGADPFSERAISRIFQIKGRAETKPILLLVGSIDMVHTVAAGTSEFERVAERFWPGPLTIVLPAQPQLSRSLTAGTGTIGVRWPGTAFPLALVRRFGRPLTATSANRSGMPSCVTAAEVAEQLGDELPVLIDGGDLPARGGSTLLDLTGPTPCMLRNGPVPFETLREFFGGRLQRREP